MNADKFFKILKKKIEDRNKEITKRNNIQNVVGYQEIKDVSSNNEVNKWKRKVLEQQMITGKIEHHLIINPHIVGYNEYNLLKVFRMILIKFYRQYLGKNFNKKKNQQMRMLFAPEYSFSYNVDRIEKHTHLHCIIQTDNVDMLKQFHKWMRKGLKVYFKKKKFDYKYKKITTSKYRLNVYNYVLKEGRQLFNNADFYYKKTDKNKPFEINMIRE